MASKSSELKNLSSRDLPTRRKAVRWLLEHEMQDSLPQFVKFIDDDDVWFREKAKYVFKKWCSDDFLDLVYELLSEKSRKYDYFISTLLFNFSKNIDGIVVKLLTSENIQVRKNTRNFQLSRAGCDNLKPLLFEALNDSDYRVRIVAVNFIDSVTLTDELINKIINDNHSKVKLTALNRLNLIDHSKWIEKFEDIKDKNIMYGLNLLKSENLLKNKDYGVLVDIFLECNLANKRKLVSKIIKFEWVLIKDLIAHLMDEKEWEFLILILNKPSKNDLMSLRYELSMNDEVPIRFRLKLIEKLKSKVNLIDLTPLIENLEESSDMRLVQEGELIRGLLNE